MTTLGDTRRAEPALDELLADLRELVECESPSDDLAAVERSADLVARLGTERLGLAPERIVVDGVHHLRWRFGSPTAPGRVLVLAHHDTVWPLGTLAQVRDGVQSHHQTRDHVEAARPAQHPVSDRER